MWLGMGGQIETPVQNSFPLFFELNLEAVSETGKLGTQGKRPYCRQTYFPSTSN